MKFIALKKHFAEEKTDPFYLITGDDGYIIKKAADVFCSLVSELPELNLHTFSENSKAADIVNACRCLPVLSKVSVVLVYNFSLDAKEIAEYLKKPSPDVVLVIVAPSITKNLTPIAKFATIVECDRLDQISLKKWVMKRCVDNGCSIEEKAAEKIVAYSDRYMARIETETEKLSSYKHGSTIESKDVDELVTPSLEYKIYELGDAIVSGRKELTLKTLRTMRDSTPANYIISGLYSYFRRLLFSVICKDGAVAEYLGVKEFAVTASRRQAAAVTPKKLKIICDRFGEADYEFKTGRIQDNLAAETIITQTVFEISEQN